MKTVFAVLTFLFLSSVIHAQNTFPVTGSVGIGTTTPNASSILEINSTTKGILIPRMTKNQRDAIVSPATGLLIYETNNTKGFFYYNGNSWMQLGSAGAGWLTGVGAPSGTLGLTGDLYLDTSTGNYYLKTATATWTLQGNLKGPAGAQGATGPQGLQGATGLQGPAGVNGANGLNGANGANGANGLNGANGVGVLSTIDNHNGTFTVYYSDGSSFTTSNLTGPQGATGAQGPQGDIGPQGPAGANGTNGVGVVSTIDNGNGTFTINYSDGSSFTTSNLTGPQGATGAQGPQGSAGSNGTNGVGVVSTIDNGNGTFTINYSDGSSFTTSNFTGPQGATGPQGSAGTNGTNGTNGVGVVSTIDNGNGTFTINYSDGSSFTTSNLTGAQGPQGDIGPQGPAGANGANGYLLPGATDGNTPYWNGSQWVLNSSNLFNDGTHIGIGTTSTSAKLNIGGNIKIADGTQGNGKFLKSDANGLASWNDVSFTDVLGSTLAPDFSCLGVVGSAATGSNPTSVAISGTYAYVVNSSSNTLQVFNVSNLSAPSLMGSVATGTYPASIAISGTYAYVVNSSSNTLQVFNVSNPSAPSLAGSVATGLYPFSIAISGTYAYVMILGSNTLQVFNVSNPSAPALLASGATDIGPYSVAVWGNYAYVVNEGSNTLQVFNVSNPSAPSLTGSVATGTSPFSVAVSGNYAYVVNGGSNTLQVFNVSNPSAPSLTGSVATGTEPFSVAVSGNYAYVNEYTFQVFNVSNPSAPSLAGSLVLGSNSLSVAVSGNYAYVPNSEFNNLKVVQLSCSIGMAFDPLTGSTEAIPQVQVWAENGNDIHNLNSGRVGIGTTSPGGQFELSLDEGRKPSTSTWTITSDERLKNIDGDYTKGLKEILQLHPIAYHYKNAGNRTFDAQVLAVQNVGFSAQDVQKIFPEAVGTDDNGYLNFNIHPILIAEVNAFKELNSKVDSLKQRSASPCNDSLVNTLQQQVNTLQQENTQQKQINSDLSARLDALLNQMNNFELSLSQCCTSFQQQKTKTSDEPVLEQNVPNPFNQTCYIKFYIPSTAKSAMLVISDVNGIVRKQFSGLQPGYGTVNIDYSSMASGAYYFSLIIDGKEFDTKQMILTR